MSPTTASGQVAPGAAVCPCGAEGLPGLSGRKGESEAQLPAQSSDSPYLVQLPSCSF